MNSPDQMQDEVDRDEFGEFMEGFNAGIGGEGQVPAEEPVGAARGRGLEAGRDARKRAEEQAVIDFMLTGEALRISSSGIADRGRSFVPGQVGGDAATRSGRNGETSGSNGQNSRPDSAATTTEAEAADAP